MLIYANWEVRGAQEDTWTWPKNSSCISDAWDNLSKGSVGEGADPRNFTGSFLATKLVWHHWACALQLLKLVHLESAARN